MRPLLIILTKIMPINYYYLIYIYIAQISSDQASIASTEGLDPCTVCSSLEWLEPLHPPRYKANALTNCPHHVQQVTSNSSLILFNLKKNYFTFLILIFSQFFIYTVPWKIRLHLNETRSQVLHYKEWLHIHNLQLSACPRNWWRSWK